MAEGSAVVEVSPTTPAESSAGALGDYDFTDPGTSLFDSVQSSAPKPAEPETPTPETPPAEPPAEPAPDEAGEPAPAAQPEQAAAPAAPATNNQAAAAIAAPQISQQQIERAARLGWTPEILQGFTNPEEGLLRAENLALNFLMAGRQQAGQPQGATGQAAPQQPQRPAVPQQFNETEAREFFTQQGFDSTIVDRFVNDARQLHGVALENQQMRQWAGELYNHVQHLTRFAAESDARAQMSRQQQAQEIIRRDFDTVKQSLDAPTRAKIDAKTQNEIFALADTIVSGHIAQGRQPPSNDAAFRQAISAVMAGEGVSIALARVRDEVKQHQDLGIARPTSGGKPRQVPGDQAAGDFADEWYRKAGLMSGGSGGLSGFEV